jgi:flagellar hook-associated protein 1 FlgK
MSGLISNLATSSKALGVHSKGLEIAGKNLANINNRNYAKQRVEIGDRGSIGTGIATESMGVEAMELRQNRDVLLDKRVMREFTASSGLEAAKKILESAENALGQFLDRTKDSTSIQNAGGANGGGISDALTDFFNAWESFSVKPNDVGEKQLLIAKAQILAEKINATDKNLKQVQTDTDSQLTTDVGIVNGILAEIAKTNEYIAKAELVKPYSAVDLRDQRQAKLEELSKYIDVTIETGELGQITVKSGDPQKTLIEGKVVTGQTINTATGELTGPFSYDAAAQKIKLESADFTSGGKLGAQLAASTGSVKTARDQIKDLAEKLKEEVNGEYQDKGGEGNVFNLSTSSTGLIQMSYNSVLKIVAGSSGGNSIALGVAELGNRIFAATDKQIFDAQEDHGFTNGDKIYKAPDGELLWFDPSIPSATRDKLIQELGITANPFILETGGEREFLLRTDANPPVYLETTDVSPPIKKVSSVIFGPETSFNVKSESLTLVDRFQIGNVGEFADGDEIQFTNLPADSNLREATVYKITHNPGDPVNIFTIEATNGDLLRIRPSDIDSATKVSKLGSSNVESSITAKMDTYPWAPGFYGEFTLTGINASDFDVGDRFQFTNLPANSGFNAQTVYKIQSKTDTTISIQSLDGSSISLKADGSDIQVGTKISFLDKTDAIEEYSISVNSTKNETIFYGEFNLGSTAGFSVGDEVKLTGLPSGSSLSSTSTYKIATINGNVATIVAQDGSSLSTKISDVVNSTKISLANFNPIKIEEDIDFESRSRGIEGSFSSYFNSLVTSLAQELNTTNTRLEDQKLSEEMATNSRDQFSGVSQDEELTDLMKFQRSFQATSRFINVVDNLLDQVVNRLGSF